MRHAVLANSSSVMKVTVRHDAKLWVLMKIQWHIKTVLKRLWTRMDMKVVLYISFIVFFTNLPQQTEQSDPILAKSHCGQVNATAFPACVKEGFSYTVISLANKYYARSYAGIIKNVMERLGDCSKYTAFMLCSLYVPRCNSSEKGPLLPCQEVCWEFVKDCGTKMDFTGLNWLKSLCSVLQNKTEKPGCFKPKDFTPSKSTFTGRQTRRCWIEYKSWNCCFVVYKLLFVKCYVFLRDRRTTNNEQRATKKGFQ